MPDINFTLVMQFHMTFQRHTVADCNQLTASTYIISCQ